jgi:2-succinyl-6-hydroxy-2,4-cyclohexadiene-1-carboxylate synthase
LTQTGRSWGRVIDALAARLDDLDAVAPDLPGHGDAATVSLDLWESAARLVDTGGTGSYVGYSMGGRVALHAAIAHPDSVRALVLIGATAGIDDPEERAGRRAADETLAARVEEIGVASFLDSWLENPLFAGLTDAAAGRSDRLRNTSSGLASSLRCCGTGTQEPLWDRLSEVRCPTLVLVGEHDAKFRALGARLVDGIPDARLEVVDGSGHSVHLEQPGTTVDALARFLSWH